MVPKFSITMPVWNRSYCIANAVQSVFDQTFKEWELIIVDDGSDDLLALKRVLARFIDPRVQLIELEHTGKIGYVRNQGNKAAKADIIVVHDSDDLAFPQRLDRIWRVFQVTNPEAELVYHSMLVHMNDPQHNAITRRIRLAEPYSKYRLLRHQYIPGQVAYRRETILKYPYDERIYCCDDYQMLLEFALNDCKFAWTTEVLYEYMMLSDSVNIIGEAVGKRKHDTQIILQILKDKYDLEAQFELTKTDEQGKIIKREVV